MGTNYYIRKKSNPEYELHMGKISCGWRFLMAGYLQSYDETTNCALTITKIRDYIDLLHKYSGDAYIIDEYGDNVSLKQFLDIVRIHQNERSHYDLHNHYLTIHRKYYDVVYNCDFS